MLLEVLFSNNNNIVGKKEGKKPGIKLDAGT